MNNAKFSVSDKKFLAWCEDNNKKPTSRMASKYRKIYHAVTRPKTKKEKNEMVPTLEVVGISNRGRHEEKTTSVTK